MAWMASLAAWRTSSAGRFPFMGSAEHEKFECSRRTPACCWTAERKAEHSGLAATYLIAFNALSFTTGDLCARREVQR